MKLSTLVSFALAGLATQAVLAADPAPAAAPKMAAAALPSVDIPYQKFVLENGLTLIVHEDHKAPVVAVNVKSGATSPSFKCVLGGCCPWA